MSSLCTTSHGGRLRLGTGQSLPDGLSEWAMHPARPHAADAGSDVRSTDYDVLTAESTRQA